MRIKGIERGLRLSSFECEFCGIEVDVDEIWSLEVESEEVERVTYRSHACVKCLRRILLEEEELKVRLT